MCAFTTQNMHVYIQNKLQLWRQSHWSLKEIFFKNYNYSEIFNNSFMHFYVVGCYSQTWSKLQKVFHNASSPIMTSFFKWNAFKSISRIMQCHSHVCCMWLKKVFGTNISRCVKMNTTNALSSMAKLLLSSISYSRMESLFPIVV